MVTAKQLLEIMPNCPKDKVQIYADNLSKAMQEANIDTVLRAAAFLGQLAWESGQLRYMKELADGTAYEGRKDLGNVQPGDGPRFKGRGPIQLTGRNNYKTAGIALGIDLENNPDRAADADIAFRVAGWYWTSRKINDKADTLNFSLVTKAINGGLNHHDKRMELFNKALLVLGRDTKI